MQESVFQLSMSSGRSLLVMINVVNIMVPCVCFQHWKHFEVKLMLYLFVHPSNGDGVNCPRLSTYVGLLLSPFPPASPSLECITDNSCFLFVHLFQAGEGLHEQKLSFRSKTTSFLYREVFFNYQQIGCWLSFFLNYFVQFFSIAEFV